MKKNFLCISMILVFAAACFAQQNNADTDVKTEAQTDIQFSVELLDTIDVEKSQRNDDFQLKLNDAVKIGDKTLKSGTKINGRVVRSEKISEGNDTSLLSLYIGSVKEGDDYFRFNATIVSVGNQPTNEASTDGGGKMEFSSSPTFSGATIISVKGKNLRIEEGTTIRLKL